MNSLLASHNLVYEERGIILGIMNFILDNMNKYNQINIENKLYFKLIRQLFPMFRVTRNYDKEKTSLNIYARSRKIKDNGLIINNLDNIKRIKSKKKHFYLLPWFNVNNPIVMFKYDKSKPKKNIDKLKRYIEKFNIIRLKEYSHERIPIMSYRFNILFWDIFVEYRILNRYCRLTNNNINSIYDFLTKYLGGLNVNVPTYVPRYIERPYIQKEYIMIDNDSSHATNQIVNQPINSPINPPINPVTNASIGLSTDIIDNSLKNQPINPLINPSIGTSTDPILNPSIGTSTDPANNIGNDFLEKFVSTINNKVGAMNNIMMSSMT